MKAALPDNETDRLKALYEWDALNAMPQSSFDRLTRLAVHVFSAPVAMITLIDSDRQIVKASFGTDVKEFSRDDCLCAHTILSDDVTIAGDVRQDGRFSDLPSVAGSPHVRFYAGSPLKTPDGFRLGSLCVLDTKPRLTISDSQIADLKDLASEITALFDLHHTKRELFAARARLNEQRRELDESRELWRKTDQRAMLALDAGGMGYWERDAETDLVTLSPSLSVVLGLEARHYQFTMDEWIQSVREDDRPTVLATIERAARTQEKYLLKYRTLTADGSERWITSSGTYYKDANGKFSGAQGVSWDSTTADTAAQKLKTSEEKFRGLSESVPVGVFCADLDGGMTYANPRTAEICGTSAEELLGDGWAKSVDPEDKPRMKEAIAANSSTLNSGDYEYRIRMGDGSVRWVHARTSILFDQNGLPSGKIGTLDDITQRRQSMQELKNAKETAEIANRTKDMFLANVSHELRTPLNGILGMTEMLLDTGLNTQQLEMAEIVKESGRSLLTLVNDMLDVGRIEAGKIEIERLPFDFPLIIKQTVSVMESEARRKNSSFCIDYPAELPTSYIGDADRIKQILLNYVSNAVKFSPAGDISISVRGERVDDSRGICVKLTLSVTDKGMGIDPDAQKALFQPFSQVDGSSTRRNGGVGLGLAISKRLAELMGGSVGLVSSPGKGSTFWLCLVLPTYVRADTPAVRSMQGTSIPSGRVLLAEDNPVNQKVAVGALRKLGWEADVAPNGLIALDLYCRNQYAMVFMDCHMPEMDGFTATKEIRNWEQRKGRPNIPIVALTAHAMVGDRERCLTAGMNDYLTKPIVLEELRGVLTRWSVVHEAENSFVP